MTAAEFTALTGLAFPLSLNDLQPALDKLQAAGYTARVIPDGNDLALVVEKSKEVPCLTKS